MKKIIPLIPVILLLAAPLRATTPDNTATTRPTPITPELLAQVQSTLKQIKTVEADFVQEKKLAMLQHTLTIRGHFATQQPDKLIWIVREPVRYAIRVQGEELQQWDEDSNRVDTIHLGKDPTFRAVSDQIQAWFMGNYAELNKNYSIGVLSEKPLSLRFSPKPDTLVAKIFQHVEVRFADDGKHIDHMLILEANGDSTNLKFLNTQVDQPIKDELWRMPPNDH